VAGTFTLGYVGPNAHEHHITGSFGVASLPHSWFFIEDHHRRGDAGSMFKTSGWGIECRQPGYLRRARSLQTAETI